MTIPSPRGILGRDSGLPLNTQSSMGTSGNVFEIPREGPSSALLIIHGIWHRVLADWDQVLQEMSWNMEEERGREPQSSSTPTPRFYQGVAEVSDLGKCILEKFPYLLQLQIWKVNFKTEECSKTAFPHITMQWIREFEKPKSTDDLLISRSITGRTDFPDYDMLDAMIASALKKLLTHVHFRKRVNVEEQRAQNSDRFLRGRQIAYMICEFFRATEACETVQGLVDLVSMTLQNTDVQDFGVKWDHALLSESEILSDPILEGLYKSKITEFRSISDCDGLV